MTVIVLMMCPTETDLSKCQPGLSSGCLLSTAIPKSIGLFEQDNGENNRAGQED